MKRHRHLRRHAFGLALAGAATLSTSSPARAQGIMVDANPLENVEVLYGTGAPKLNDETGRIERVGGIEHTIKDGIVYDAQKVLADVREMVRKQKAERNITQGGGAR